MNTSSTLRTFITGVTVSSMSNVTADDIKAFLTVVGLPNNNLQIFLMSKLSLTSQASPPTMINFPAPIELKKGTAINFEHVFTVGAAEVTFTLFGYTQEV